MTIFGVHGVGQQRLGCDQLTELWEPAMRDGVAKAGGDPGLIPPLNIVYYGDCFLSREKPIQVQKGSLADQWWTELADDELADLIEMASESVTAEEIAAAQQTPAKAYTRAPRALQVLVGAIGRRYGWPRVALLFGSLRQVRRYLRDPLVKAEVDCRMAMITGCRVLIAHSLGSVIALDHVIRHPHGDLELLLTIGSPLGLRIVREWMPEIGVVPEGVRRWVNVYAPQDPVVCAGALGRWWDGVQDLLVDNGRDAHAASRYLRQKETGLSVLSGLTSRTHQRE